MTYDWSVIWDHRFEFLNGIWVTIAIAVSVMAMSVPLGIGVMLLRQCGIRVVEVIATTYVEVFRNVPLLLLVFWAYYALPRLTGASLSNVQTGMIALVLNVTAYNSENFRAGVNSIRKGQLEAGLALGMSWSQAMRKVVLPQAIRRVIPVLASQWVSLFKGTSLVSAIGVADLAYVGLQLRGSTFRVLEILTALAAIYWVLAYPQAKLVDWLHRKYGAQE